MTTRLEDDLRQARRTGSEHLATPSAVYGRDMGTVGTRRWRRRRVGRGSGAAALAAAAVIGLAAGAAEDGARRGTPATEERSDAAPSWDVPWRWPARGSLAADPDFVAEFDERLGSVAHLVYAEDGAAGRVVVAVARTEETVVLHGPRGADLATLDRVTGEIADPAQIVVALPIAQGHLVLLLAPQKVNEAQISTPTLLRDGSIDRHWRQIPVDGGVGRTVTDISPEVTWVRTPIGGGSMTVLVGDGSPALGTLSCERCDDGWLSEEGLTEFRDGTAHVLGVASEDVPAKVLFDVTIPDSTTGDATRAVGARLVGYVATAPSGGLLRSTYLVTEQPQGTTVELVEWLGLLPAGDEARPLFLPPRVAGRALVVAPGAARVRFTPPGDGAPVIEVVLTDGIAVVPGSPTDIGDHTVTAFDPDGTLRGRWHGRGVQSEDPDAIRR